MLKDTLKKFGYPNTLLKEYKYWLLLIRQEQVTLGSMILICKDDVTSFHSISPDATSELSIITKEIELGVISALHAQKVNYLMLMMNDPEVHFHVIPRYDANVKFHSSLFKDNAWPAAANLGSCSNVISDDVFYAICEYLRECLAQSGSIKKYARMYTSGCFDIMHYGHLNIFKNSKALTDHLIVGVSTDELIQQTKGRKPIIPFEERFNIVKSIKYVDEVIPQVDKNKQRVVDEYDIDAISVGSDWKGKYPPVTCEMVYFDYTPNVSSTVLKKALNLLNNEN